MSEGMFTKQNMFTNLMNGLQPPFVRFSVTLLRQIKFWGNYDFTEFMYRTDPIRNFAQLFQP